MNWDFGIESWPNDSERKLLTFHQMGQMDGFGGRKNLKIYDDQTDGFAVSVLPTVLDFGEECDSHEFVSPENIQPEAAAETALAKEKLAVLAKKALRPVNKFHFPVTKTNPGPAGHKPLTIGGAKQKRDAAGHCVSEAFLTLKFGDSSVEDIEPVRKKQHTASSENIQKPVEVIRPPITSSGGGKSKKNVIGDQSRPYLLPTVSSRHCELKYISPDTLKRLMLNEFSPEEIERFWIVDCRYPYEYTAGHIRSAINAYHREELVKQFLDRPYVRQNPRKRVIVVFHCEYSAERGPLLARYMRNEDRKMHQYPYLAYPEIYLLDGGYKAFFEHAMEFCEPPFYTPMRSALHQTEFIQFKGKAKSFHDFTVMTSRRSGNLSDVR